MMFCAGYFIFFFFKQKTAYEMRISDWSSDVCSSDLSPAVPRTIALVGLMGAGKSCIGRLLAGALGLPFLDADKEIEAAAGCTVEDIFTAHGEAAFREGERRVIARLLAQPRMVLATGGGAFMDPATRHLERKSGVAGKGVPDTVDLG